LGRGEREGITGRRKSARLPDWVKRKERGHLHDVKRLMRALHLSTVCEEAKCPNASSCFAKPTAAFLILGDRCTRTCTFCSVKKGTPSAIDAGEPQRIARAAEALRLRHVVITSVTRDDLSDGGASHFAATIRAVTSMVPDVTVEVLTPDFNGEKSSVAMIASESPAVFNHNLETVPRLYPSVRPEADVSRSLRILEYVKKSNPRVLTKSGLMLGLGETLPEVRLLLKNLREAGCELVTIGQYLRPSKRNRPVSEYVDPEIFEELRLEAMHMGFAFAASAPLARSSMNADEMFQSAEKL
jgi:lipoyl synthase